jgi:serine/threonine protein kinase
MSIVDITSDSPTTEGRTVIGDRYEVQKKLGSGSMGCVYLCRDSILNDELIALKILFRDLSDDPTYIARFQREVILARQLGHPNIVRVYDYGITPDLEHYFTMELLTSGSLRDELKRGPLSFAHAADYFYTIVAAISHAHELNVVHRDIKPDNILFTSSGTLKITDFGTARGAMAAQQNLTQTGDSLGTPIYMAPEIVQGGRGDKQSDLYSLGVLAHELVMGTPPFVAQTWVALAAMHVSKPAPEIQEDKAPVWYRDMVLRLLEKDPANRFSSASDLFHYVELHHKEKETRRGNSALIPSVMSGGIGMLVGSLLGRFL